MFFSRTPRGSIRTSDFKHYLFSALLHYVMPVQNISFIFAFFIFFYRAFFTSRKYLQKPL
jgi:hypothetical protein